MRKNNLNLIGAILAIILATLACGPAATQAPQPAQIIAPTETPAPVNDASHEIYAGATGNKALPYIMLHRSGESLVGIQEAGSVNLSGVIWTSPNGESIVIHSDGNGLPISAVVGEDTILYSNYTHDTVDMTIIHQDGTSEAFQAKPDSNLLNLITAFNTPAYSLVSYPLSNLHQPAQWDTFIAKTLLYMTGAAVCIASVPAAIANPLIGIPLLLDACSGSLLGTLIRVGSIAGLDVGDLQTIKNNLDIAKCSTGMAPLACANVYVTTAEEQENKASSIKSKAQVALVPSPTEYLTSTPGYPTLFADQNYLCLEGPDRSYKHAHDILYGTSYKIIGRSSNGWYEIAISFADSHHTSCWSGGGVVSGDINSIPLVEADSQDSICGWIENHSSTGAWVGTLTVASTGQVIELALMDGDAGSKLGAFSIPGNFKIYGPVYYSETSLRTFSRIEPVSSCP
jgi:hypothetical protein